MLNYDKPSRIFPCLLLTRNHMIFLVQFGINKHLLIFSKTTNCTRPTGSCNFFSFKKFTRAYLFQIALEINWLPTQISWLISELLLFFHTELISAFPVVLWSLLLVRLVVGNRLWSRLFSGKRKNWMEEFIWRCIYTSYQLSSKCLLKVTDWRVSH